MSAKRRVRTFTCVLVFLLSAAFGRQRAGAAGQTPTNGAANPTGQQNSGSGGGGGSLLAESKSAVFAALADGLNEIAAEIASTCAHGKPHVVFNLPISAQDAANVRIMEEVLKTLTAEAGIAKEGLPKIEDLNRLQKEIDDCDKNPRPGGDISVRTAPTTPSTPSNPLTTAAGIASNFNTISAAASAALTTLAQFKNQATNTSGSVTLDAATVNGLLTVALLKKKVPVHDFAKLLLQPCEFKSDSGLLKQFNDLVVLVTSFHHDASAYVNKFNEMADQYSKCPSPQQSVVDELNQVKANAQNLEKLDSELQAQLNALLTGSASSQKDPSAAQSSTTPSASTPGGAGGDNTKSPSPIASMQPLILNSSQFAQCLLAAEYLERLKCLDVWRPGDQHGTHKEVVSDDPRVYFVTCRLVSADATETTVKRYLLEDYTVASAVTTLEVDAYGLDGQCCYAASIENRGANLYWFSRIKDAAQMSPRAVANFPWIFHPPRQPQITVTRESSSKPNLQQKNFEEFSQYHDRFTDWDLVDRIRAVLEARPEHRARIKTIADKLDQEPDTIARCVKAHGETFEVKNSGFFSYWTLRANATPAK